MGYENYDHLTNDELLQKIMGDENRKLEHHLAFAEAQRRRDKKMRRLENVFFACLVIIVLLAFAQIFVRE